MNRSRLISKERLSKSKSLWLLARFLDENTALRIVNGIAQSIDPETLYEVGAFKRKLRKSQLVEEMEREGLLSRQMTLKKEKTAFDRAKDYINQNYLGENKHHPDLEIRLMAIPLWRVESKGGKYYEPFDWIWRMMPVGDLLAESCDFLAQLDTKESRVIYLDTLRDLGEASKWWGNTIAKLQAIKDIVDDGHRIMSEGLPELMGVDLEEIPENMEELDFLNEEE